MSPSLIGACLNCDDQNEDFFWGGGGNATNANCLRVAVRAERKCREFGLSRRRTNRLIYGHMDFACSTPVGSRPRAHLFSLQLCLYQYIFDRLQPPWLLKSIQCITYFNKWRYYRRRISYLILMLKILDPAATSMKPHFLAAGNQEWS